jgi:predicted transcriptional regulator YheO
LGDASALDDVDFDPSDRVIGPYEKLNWDGRRIRSVSIIIRGAQYEPMGVMCINADISTFDAARAALDLFLNAAPVAPQPDKLFRDDWQERINIFLKTWQQEHRLSLSALSRPQKRQLVEALFHEGAFAGKSATNYVANVLGLSRATVFNYLKALKENA